MSNRLAQRFGMVEDAELIPVLKATAFKGQVSDAQMTALLIVADQYGLNPWTKEIYAFPDPQNGIVPVVSVDGWSRIINEHPAFDGIEFELSGKGDDMEMLCRIFRKDRSRPIAVTEYLTECKRETKPWKSHPRRMLRHKAEIQCARLAFGFAGLHDHDEAERIVEASSGAPKNMGAAQVVEAAAAAEMPLGLLESAESAATEGVAIYQEFWKSTGPENRKALAGHHARLKQAAIDADAARTVEMPTTGGQAEQPTLDLVALERRIGSCNDAQVLLLIADDVATLPEGEDRARLEKLIAVRGEALEG
jgi:phage recombination protein Bet